MTIQSAEQKVASALGMKISNYADYSDGFSFTVATELEAYKAAYIYRNSKRVRVQEAPNVGAWLVQVYNQ